MERIFADYSALEGTNCYCSADSADRIREHVAGLPLHAFHEIGTGDYHYISLFWLERLEEPFQLVLFDHHPDDQPGAFGDDLLSCGSWVAHARSLTYLQRDCWIRDAVDFPILAALPDLPVYVSIDLDVLSREYARTDWDQGQMTMPELSGALRSLIASHRILGVDLCGGHTLEKGASPEDLALNAVTGEALFDLFRAVS